MKFTIRDLLIVTATTAIAVWFIMLLGRLAQTPQWVLISTGWLVVGAVIGILIGQFRGGVIGTLIGGCLALVSIIAYGSLVWRGSSQIGPVSASTIGSTEEEIIVTYTVTTVRYDPTWLWVALVVLMFAVVGAVVAFVANRRDGERL